MTQKTRHAAGRVVFGQAVSRQNVRKSWVTGRCEAIFLTRKPLLRRIRGARVEFIRDGRLERLVMSWERAVFQSFWYVNPAQTVLVQDERCITRNCIETFSAYFGLIVWRLALYKSGNIDSGPFFGVPPN